MVKRALFFSLSCGFFSLAFGMDNTPQELIEKHKETFPDFVKTLRKETNIGKKVAKLPFLSSYLESSAKKNGYNGDVKSDMEFLKRFFAKEYTEKRKELIGNKKSKKSGTFGDGKHQNIVHSILTQFNQSKEQTFDTLNNIIHQLNIKTFQLDQATTKEDMCKKVQEKQNGKYAIADDIYFTQTVCILFTVHVYQTVYGDKK